MKFGQAPGGSLFVIRCSLFVVRCSLFVGLGCGCGCGWDTDPCHARHAGHVRHDFTPSARNISRSFFLAREYCDLLVASLMPKIWAISLWSYPSSR